MLYLIDFLFYLFFFLVFNFLFSVHIIYYVWFQSWFFFHTVSNATACRYFWFDVFFGSIGKSEDHQFSINGLYSHDFNKFSLFVSFILRSDFSFRFSPGILPGVHSSHHHVLNSHPAIVTPGPKQDIGQDLNHRYSRLVLVHFFFLY